MPHHECEVNLMPARRRALDPNQSELAAFAFDLRKLGEGKVPITLIADLESSHVSRAALYGALSGTRVPSYRTLSILLRYWIGVPVPSSGWSWDWIDRLTDSPEKATTREWMRRRDVLQGENVWAADRAKPITIAPPPEQIRFVEYLRAGLEVNGLLGGIYGENDWNGDLTVLVVSPQRLQRYFAFKELPTERSFRAIAAALEEWGGDVLELHSLWSQARAARVRDRRAARLAARR
jgi:hypothetical protein